MLPHFSMSYSSVTKYINGTNMDRNGTWGTDIEVILKLYCRTYSNIDTTKDNQRSQRRLQLAPKNSQTGHRAPIIRESPKSYN